MQNLFHNTPDAFEIAMKTGRTKRPDLKNINSLDKPD